ncbi:copper resistance protein CopC [Streptomyces sp. enrichment culture]|uniref:copper resistance CopC/CopD family protein n=1 Tax=Streptomyces sp. enrichment culture TaxID=1795815 RepID=UPI003F563380
MEQRRSESVGGGRNRVVCGARRGSGAPVPRRLRALVLLGGVLVLLLLGSAGPASAHAALRGSDPEDGSVAKTVPEQVTLTFTESVGLMDDSVRIYGPDNRRVHVEEPRHAEGASDTAVVELPDDLAEGTYTIAWRVISADSHPSSGAFTFSIGKPSPTPPAAPTDPGEHPVTASLYNTARYLAYVAAVLLIGAAAFVALCRPTDTAPLRLPLLTGWWTLLGSTVVLLVLRAPFESAAPPSGVFDTAAVSRALGGRPALALMARLVLTLLAGVFLLRLARRREDGRRPTAPHLAAGGALSVGFALTWAAAEHASAGIQVPVAMTSSVVHLLATACWLGGLVALLVLLFRAKTPPPTATVTRFSRVAFLSVVVLAVTGVYQSWRGLGSWAALTGTPYGRTLTAKLVAVAVLLLVAGLSRRWTARLAQGRVREPEAAPVPDPVPELVTVGGDPRTAPAASPAGGEPGAARATASLGDDAPGSPDTPATPGAGEASDGAAAGDRPAPGASSAPSGSPAPSSVSGTPEGPQPSGSPDAATLPTESAAGPDTPGSPDTPEDLHRRALRLSVLVEVAVAVVVLLITTVLTSTLPARAQAEAEASGPPQVAGLPAATSVTIPYDIGPGKNGTVQLTLDPGRVGENSVQAVTFGPSGALAIVPEVRLSFTLEAKDIGPIDARLTDRGGYWATSDLVLPIEGTWTMKTTVRVSEVDQVTETRRIRITR